MSAFITQLKDLLMANHGNTLPPIMNTPRDFSLGYEKKAAQGPADKRDILLALEKLNSQISLEKLGKIHSLLCGGYSKNLFVQLVALRLVFSKLSLDVERSPLWSLYSKIAKSMEQAPHIKANKETLSLYDLSSIGYDLQMYYFPIGIFTNFVLKQYEFTTSDALCSVEKDDYVIDGGACFGDTALYFSHEVGDKGKVFSFEFIQDNIAVFKKNAALNRQFAQNIRLFPHPLWSVSGKDLYIIPDGPASRITSDKPAPGEQMDVVQTISIDDFVESRQIKKIDFIKLDIEGAELEALHGAEATIKKFRPKLAVCLYHNILHFFDIPNYLHELDLGYTFYLDHFTPHLGETVLFAVPPKNAGRRALRPRTAGTTRQHRSLL